MPPKGLASGNHLFRFEYDYEPRVRPYEHTVAGKAILGRIHDEADGIAATLEALIGLRQRFAAIATEAASEGEARWQNPWLPALDAMLVYAWVVTLRPARYLEVGSGDSTRFARRAIQDHGLPTRIVSVDPSPRAEIDALCDEVVRSRIEDADIDRLVGDLQSNDVVFLDNSHRSFQNSDVTVCCTELIPALPAGCCYGIHDIYLPFDYPPWCHDCFFNEQYLLAMYLAGGAGGDRIVMPTFYACAEPRLADLTLRALDLPNIPLDRRGGSSIWLRKA